MRWEDAAIGSREIACGWIDDWLGVAAQLFWVREAAPPVLVAPMPLHSEREATINASERELR
jgi:hypothetical protein